jgi:hypothetical protein
MYEGIKQATGLVQNKSSPLLSLNGETIKDRAQQMERWVEHYSELYSKESIVNEKF